MNSAHVAKLSACLVILMFLINNVQGQCWRYGHSCWGGHGKRSDGSRTPGLTKRIFEHDSSLTDEWVAHFQDYSSLQQEENAGIDSSSSELIKRHPKSFFRARNNDVVGNKILSAERLAEIEDVVPSAEDPDGYDQANFDSFLPAHSRKTDSEISFGLDRPESNEKITSSEDEDSTRQTADYYLSRRSPSDNFLLYKLTRVWRKK